MIVYNESNVGIFATWENAKKRVFKLNIESGIARYADLFNMNYKRVNTLEGLVEEIDINQFQKDINNFSKKISTIESVVYSKIVVIITLVKKCISREGKIYNNTNSLIYVTCITEHLCTNGKTQRVYSNSLLNPVSINEGFNILMKSIIKYIISHSEKHKYFPIDSVNRKVKTLYFTPNAAGMLLHESFGHLFEMDNYHFNKDIIREIFDMPTIKDLNISDDPSVTSIAGYMNVDDLGFQSNKLDIIRNGIITDEILNGRRIKNKRISKYSSLWKYRVSNTIMLPGAIKKEDLLCDLNEYIYITKIDECFCDPITGRVVLPIVESYTSSNGKKKKILGPFLISCSISDIWKSLNEITNEFEKGSILCGKFGDRIFVGTGAPGILLKDFDIR